MMFDTMFRVNGRPSLISSLVDAELPTQPPRPQVMVMAVSLRRYTVTELDAFPPDGNRYELLDGVLFVTPAPGPMYDRAYKLDGYLAMGVREVWLVDPRKLKHVPGRKTDVVDCQWLPQRHTFGLLSPAFRPEERIAVLRSYLRQRAMLVPYAGAAHPAHAEGAATDERAAGEGAQRHHRGDGTVDPGRDPGGPARSAEAGATAR